MIVLQDHFERKPDNNGDMIRIKPEDMYNMSQWWNRKEYSDALLEIFRYNLTSNTIETKAS